MTTNPLLDDIDEGALPPVPVALPTRGQFYADGVLAPGANPDDLMVHSISMLEENSFNDPVMMLSGRAVARMIRRVCPEINDPASLSEIDVNALLIAARIASYGADLKVNLTCPDEKCREKHPHPTAAVVDLDTHLLQYEPFTPEEFEEFRLVLPVAGQTVHLMPLSYADAVDMQLTVYRSERTLSALNSEEANNVSEEFVRVYADVFDRTIAGSIHTLAGSIYAVTTRTGKSVMERKHIEEWITHLVPKDVNAIQRRLKPIMTKLRDRSRITFECQGCKTEQSTYLEIDPQKLFTEAEEPETETSSSAASESTAKKEKKLSRISRK